ncbi:MAG: hypothetical protein ACJ8E3_10185 [Sphingomicrobium sp.]
MQLFKIVGTWFGGLFLMALGCLWLGMAYYLTGYSAFGALPTVIGLIVLGSVTLLAGMITFVRGLASARPAPLPEGSTGWRDDGEPSESKFDADAAIARYLQNRPAADSAEAEATTKTPVRPTFGRKRA